MKKNIVEFPDRSVIEEEASAWLIRLDGDAAPSTEELASLREWLARSPVHREELGALAKLWGRMNVLTELSVPLGKPDTRDSTSVIERLRYTGVRFGRVAIATSVFAGAVALALTLWLRPDPYLESNGLYATAVGQQQTMSLADGSDVLLNTNSQIEVAYSGDYRNIRLIQGEAHFTVARNASKPFRVYAGYGRVQALGTAFSVYLKDDKVDVTVTEGSVTIASLDRSGSGDSSLEFDPRDGNHSSGSPGTTNLEYVETLSALRAGQSATMQIAQDANSDIRSAIDTIETVEATEMAKRLSWRDGVVTFSGDPLEEVVAEISRYTTVSIEISDPAVRAISIGGRFPVGETDAMLEAFETNFGLRVTRLNHDRVLISAAEN